MSLYHAYRPQTFSAIVGQDHIKQTLQSAVAGGHVAHAYLFSGPRGIGKTSVARILAMAVNCDARRKTLDARESKKTRNLKLETNPKSEIRNLKSEPCGSCSSCTAIRSGNDLNVIEIDAASNRGIDEIRALKESVGFSPGGSLNGARDGLRRVYIIDEVHMLTKEAFNALLKTLEEPPKHALFILATTELHRVPDTIISRTQHFEFKRATLADTKTHLQTIAKSEKLTLEDEATLLIALHADGAFRDALSLLDQLAALGAKRITADEVRLLLGIAPEAELLQLLAASFDGKPEELHGKLERFAEHGYDPSALIDALITALRHVLWAHHGITGEGSELLAQFATKHGKTLASEEIVSRIERLITAKQQLRWSPLPMLPLELALLPIQEIRNSNHETRNKPETPALPAGRQTQKLETTSAHPPRHPEPEDRDHASAPDSGSLPVQIPDPKRAVDTSLSVGNDKKKVARDDRNGTMEQSGNEAAQPSSHVAIQPLDLVKLWPKILESIRSQNAQLAALLKSSKLLGIADTVCTIQVPFSFYADRITDRKNAQLIAEVLLAEVGISCTVRCTVIDGPSEQSAVSPPAGEAGSKQSPSPPKSRTSAEVERDIVEIFGATELTHG